MGDGGSANRRGFAELRADSHLFSIDVGSEMNRADVHRGPRLKVDGLPDSLGFAVTLFALEFERMRRVVHAHDLVAIMNAGQIEQYGTPEDVRRAPKSRFVAEFLESETRQANAIN